MAGSKTSFRRLPLRRYERSFEKPLDKDKKEETEETEDIQVRTDITSNPASRNTTGTAGVEKEDPSDHSAAMGDIRAKTGSALQSGLVLRNGLNKIVRA